ncbi:hypothetical protein BGZ65_010640 [Modicella reniformis]|uniref:Uncharacterized protein n=1 Tax=Modicella reniformis TaxID=1440133 RepID=A0A9P6LTJ9_9FUNG|nr:hypothetical protein BGZ65_010640 [Modicella reniformis]
METTSRTPTPKPTTKPTTTTTTPILKPKPTQTQTVSNPPKNSPSSSSGSPTGSSGTLGPSPTAEPSTASKGFSTAAIAGIGAAGGLIVLFILAIFLCKKRRAYVYAKRDFGHDSSRDPINPNDVLPPENKHVQTLSPLQEDASELVSHPMAERTSDQDSRTQRTQQQQDYQSHRGSPAGTEAPMGRTQPGPALISTNISLDSPRTLPLTSPSQRTEFNYQQNSQDPISPRTLRSHQQQLPSSEARPGPDEVIVNDMGNQLVLQTNNSSNSNSDASGVYNSSTEKLRDSYDYGSAMQSESSYRQSPGRNQDSNVGGMDGNPPSSHLASYPGPQQRGGQPGYSNNGSLYSSPLPGLSQPSPRPIHAQYQPPQPHPQQHSQQLYSQQAFGQHSPQVRPMYSRPGPSSPVYPQQRPPYSGGVP